MYGSHNFRDPHILVTNINKCIDRSVFRLEFQKFGEIRKLFTDPEGKFVKIYFKDKNSYTPALNALKHNPQGWILQGYFDSKNPSEHNITESKYEKPGNNSKMLQEYSQCEAISDEFVNVFGDPMEIFADETGENFVNLRAVQKMGFAIFTRPEYESLRRYRNSERNDVIKKEFNLYMLTKASEYLLENNVKCINDDDILDVINRCKMKLGIEGDLNLQDNGSKSATGFTVTIGNNLAKNKAQSNDKLFSPPRENSVNSVSNTNRSLNYNNSTYPRKPYNNAPDTRARQNNDEFQRNKQDGRQMRSPGSNNFGGSNASFEKQNDDTQSETSDHSSSSQKHAKKVPFAKFLEDIDKIDKIILQINKKYNVRISSVDTENVCWVQTTESIDELLEFVVELNSSVDEIEDVKNIKRGQLAIAPLDDIWYRCRVMSTDPLQVLFIDYGNKEIVSSIKELPQQHRKLPAAANRITVSTQSFLPKLVPDLDLKISIIKQFQDGTYCVDIEPPSNQPASDISPKPAKQVEELKQPARKEVEEKRVEQEVQKPIVQEKHYFDVPASLAELKDGDKVMLIDLIDNKFAVRTKECAQKNKEILEYIKNLDKSEMLLTSVKEGQLILCSKDGLPNLCRGVVQNKVSPTIVTVKYLDCPGEDQLSVKSLRNVDDYLAAQGCTLLMTPKMEFINDSLDNHVEFISRLFENKEKATIVMTGAGCDLRLQSGNLLSEELNPVEEELPKLVPVTSTPNNSEVEKKVPTPKIAAEKVEKKEDKPVSLAKKSISYDDMPFIKAEIGTSGSYLCYDITSLEDMTFISMSEESVEYLEKVTDMLQVLADDNPFKPELLDMCLVLYKSPDETEACLNRAVVIDENESGYIVNMVDFGTKATVASGDIRKFPEELKSIPILGIPCALKNIPNTQKNIDRVKELIPEGEEVNIKILEYINDEKYMIEIPEVEKELKK
ncbi:unnamed protein product [Phyllotreta striolata]|uniref:Tudor domain-containing protein n=1 Tax=Phyllotreta striolata TaxID=444603 RepID=A0A9N9TUP0_PHYSR|nr:unnamed protein product [Phyllotreta striolata]